MSESYLILIPDDPWWVPGDAALSGAFEALQGLAPQASEVSLTFHPGVQFIDQGQNFERVNCPNCAAEIGIPTWQAMMDAAWGPEPRGHPGFGDLSCVAPCCAVSTNLNELTYTFPAGFATFELVARDPGRGWLDAAELEVVENALGHSCRQILRHS